MSNTILETTAKEYYMNTLRDKLSDTLKFVKTDPNLFKTCEKLIMVTDENINNLTKDSKELIEEAIVPLVSVISQKEYYIKKSIQLLSEEDRNQIRDINTSCGMFLTILHSEKKEENVEKKEAKRLNYETASDDANKGKNKDYDTHNMKELTKKIDNPIFPNTTR